MLLACVYWPSLPLAGRMYTADLFCIPSVRTYLIVISGIVSAVSSLLPLAAKPGATLAAHLAAAEELQRRPRERGGAPKARRSPLTLSPCYYRRSTHTYGEDRRPHYTRIASAA